jgi:hypothetical protein
MQQTIFGTQAPTIEEQDAADRLLGNAAMVQTAIIDDSPPGQRLWDTVDEQWTVPFPPAIAQRSLRKVVDRCTGCRDTFVKPGMAAEHIAQTMQRWEQHKGAKVEFQTTTVEGSPQPVQVCSGCGGIFPARKDAGKKHLRRATEAGPAHAGANVVTILRFSLAPPVSVVSAVTTAEPEVNREAGKRKRNRKRRHPRSRARG